MLLDSGILNPRSTNFEGQRSPRTRKLLLHHSNKKYLERIFIHLQRIASLRKGSWRAVDKCFKYTYLHIKDFNFELNFERQKII